MRSQNGSVNADLTKTYSKYFLNVIFAPTLKLACVPLLNYIKLHILLICINICADKICSSM